MLSYFFYNTTAPTEIYTLSLHDALPISNSVVPNVLLSKSSNPSVAFLGRPCAARLRRSEEHTSELQSRRDLVCRLLLEKKKTKHAMYSGCALPDVRECR